MKISKPLKIIGIIVCTLLILAVFGNLTINALIKNRLPKIIEERNDTAYQLTYDDINFSVFSNSLSIENAEIKPKANVDIKKDIDFFGKVEKISVTGVNFFELIKNKNLKAFTISIIGPDLTVLQTEKRDTIPTQSKLTTVIDIDKINVQKAHLRMMNVTNDTLLHELFNFNATIDGIHMGAYTTTKDIPFTYTDYRFKIDSVYSVVNDLQFAKSKTIEIDKDHVTINNFKLLPFINANDFKSNEIQASTRLLVDVPKLHLKNTDWGYKRSQLYVDIKNISIDSINIQILDQKDKRVGKEPKTNVNNIVQPLIPFQLNIDELAIKKSSFNSLGTLDISNVNINIKGITNEVNQQLKIKEFELNNPYFVQIATKNKRPNKSRTIKLNDVIIIDKVLVNDAHYLLKDASGKKNQLTVDKFNLQLNNVRVDDATVLQNVPFTYTDPLLTSGKISYDSKGDYKIEVANLTVKESNASVKQFKMIPKLSRSQHVAKLKYAQDYYNLSASSLLLNNFKWGVDTDNEFFIKFQEVVLNGMDAQIYRDISVPLNPKKNHLYSYRLRNLAFPFHVQTLKIKNSKLTYQEDSKTSSDPGKLTFTNFNLTAENLYSGYKRKFSGKTQIMVQTKFMNQGGLIASWQFNILDRTEQFNINGNLKNFPAPAMNPFLKPYLNIRADGQIDHMAFNFSGNDLKANGDYAMNFNNLKMTLFNKEDKERKFLTAAANLVVRSDTDGLKKTEVKEVERHQQKSFFNFLWLCIMQGLKQTVI